MSVLFFFLICIKIYSGNIPGNNVTKGETIVEYLQPFPPKGTGYHRMVFVLYKQTERLDYKAFKREGEWYFLKNILSSSFYKYYYINCSLNLEDRTFSTFNFYRERQDILTPAGLAFYQSDWDNTLKDFFHNKLSEFK